MPEQEQAFEREMLAATAAARQAEDDLYDEFATASNAVVDLVDAGRFDEAEEAAQDLLDCRGAKGCYVQRSDSDVRGLVYLVIRRIWLPR